MRLPVAQLKEGENPYHFDNSRDAWVRDVMKKVDEKGTHLEGPFSLDVNITKLEPDYYVRGKMSYKVEQPCARCAEVVPFPIDHKFELAMAHVEGDKDLAPKMSEESEELDVNYFAGADIDLEPVLEEQVFLSLPYRTLCKTDCKGICQRCGKNLNTGSCDCKEDVGENPFSILKTLRR